MKTACFFVARFGLAITLLGFYDTSTAQVVNDDPCSAIFLQASDTTCIFSAYYTNLGASNSPGVPAPGCGSYTGGDVWFTTVVPPSGRLEIHFGGGTNINPAAAAYLGTCSSLQLIACDDDAGPALLPFLAFSCLNPGDTVYIRVWGHAGMAGTFQVCAQWGLNCIFLAAMSQITGIAAPCQYDTVTYAASPSGIGVDSLNWSVSNGTVVGGGGPYDTTVTVAWTNPGAGSVSVSLTNCCGVTSAVRSLPVAVCSYVPNPVAMAQHDTVCAGCLNLLFVDTNAAGICTHYEWYQGSCSGTPIATGPSALIFPSTTTTYAVRPVGNTYCGGGGVCSWITVYVSANATHDLLPEQRLTLTTNASGTLLTVRADIPFIRGSTVFGMDGKMLVKSQAIHASSEHTVDISSLVAGMYIVLVRTEDGLAGIRFYKK